MEVTSSELVRTQPHRSDRVRSLGFHIFALRMLLHSVGGGYLRDFLYGVVRDNLCGVIIIIIIIIFIIIIIIIIIIFFFYGQQARSLKALRHYN